MKNKASENCLNLIKEHEGLRLSAYKCTGRKWTIGCGHTANVKPYDVITIDEAEELLQKDIETAERAVNELVKVKLNQNQFDALVSFVFNIGRGSLKDGTGFISSTMLKFINAGHFPLAAGQFDRWVYSDGKITKGLVKRRAAEKALFLKPIE